MIHHEDAKDTKVGEGWEDFQILSLDCATCGEEFDILVRCPADIDACVRESGHEGHDFVIFDYEQEGFEL